MFDYYVGTSPITSKKIRTEYKKKTSKDLTFITIHSFRHTLVSLL